MYTSIYYDSKQQKIHVWGDGQHNDAGYQVHDHVPYAYVLDPRGEYVTIDGHKCKKTKKWSPDAEKMGLAFEYDVPATTRYIIDNYLDHDDPSPDVKTLFLDIEVVKGDRFSTVEAAENVVNAITYRVTGDPVYRCLLLDEFRPPSKFDRKVDIRDDKGKPVYQIDTHTETFRTERDLLRKFIAEYVNLGHSIITGWNVEFFDMPYLFNRLVNLFDYNFARNLSPDARLVERKHLGYGQTVNIAGVTILDYLNMYKKFTYSEQSNYRLDTIARAELGRGKIQYDGSLDDLYKTDIAKFAEYNIVDVELVVAMDTKLGFIDTALGICHTGHVAHSDIQFTSRYLDGAALTYCRRNGLVASANKSDQTDRAKGAFVKKPTPGLYKWVYDLDLTSLYPMNMITLNISPETKFGKVLNWDEDEFARGCDTQYQIKLYRDLTPAGEFGEMFQHSKLTDTVVQGSEGLLKFLITYNLSIASNGCMYMQDKPGVIPAILSMWFDDRTKFKNLRKKFEAENDAQKAAFYDKKQLIVKIMLNSFYGVLLLPTFRFYDKDNGEAVTLTGQSVIQWASRAADNYYNRQLGTSQEEYCIYTDTDSLFYPIEPLFVHQHGDMAQYSDAEIIAHSKKIIGDVQSWINLSFTAYAKRIHNVSKHYWDIKQELIAKRAFWVGKLDDEGDVSGVKKRYAQWIVDKEGHPVDKMDVKGLDVVRSSFPESFRGFMDTILQDILHDATKEELNAKVREFKAAINTADVSSVMLPTGVKDMDKWKMDGFGKRMKGTPVHVKSAMNYNDLLGYFSIHNVPPISDGEKILWTYLKQNPYKFDTLALKGYEDPEQLIQIVHEYIDRDALFEKALKKKLNNFWVSLGWGEIVMNSLSNKFFSFS